jgi:hypothetical protein
VGVSLVNGSENVIKLSPIDPDKYNKVFAGDLFMEELRNTITKRKKRKISKKDKQILELSKYRSIIP